MEVILKEDVEKLGHRGDVVKVADGYGRNYLLPGKLAIEATAANKAVIEQMKHSAVRKLAKEKVVAEELSKKLRVGRTRLRAQGRRKRPPLRLRHLGRHRPAARGEGLPRRPPQDLPRGAAQVSRRVPRPDQAAPRGHHPPQGHHQLRRPGIHPGGRRRSRTRSRVIAASRTYLAHPNICSISLSRPQRGGVFFMGSNNSSLHLTASQNAVSTFVCKSLHVPRPRLRPHSRAFFSNSPNQQLSSTFGACHYGSARATCKAHRAFPYSRSPP